MNIHDCSTVVNLYSFNDDHMVTRSLVEILKSKYDSFYSSWKKIATRTRDMWFHEFEARIFLNLLCAFVCLYLI